MNMIVTKNSNLILRANAKVTMETHKKIQRKNPKAGKESKNVFEKINRHFRVQKLLSRILCSHMKIIRFKWEQTIRIFQTPSK